MIQSKGLHKGRLQQHHLIQVLNRKDGPLARSKDPLHLRLDGFVGLPVGKNMRQAPEHAGDGIPNCSKHESEGGSVVHVVAQVQGLARLHQVGALLDEAGVPNHFQELLPRGTRLSGEEGRGTSKHQGDSLLEGPELPDGLFGGSVRAEQRRHRCLEDALADHVEEAVGGPPAVSSRHQLRQQHLEQLLRRRDRLVQLSVRQKVVLILIVGLLRRVVLLREHGVLIGLVRDPQHIVRELLLEGEVVQVLGVLEDHRHVVRISDEQAPVAADVGREEGLAEPGRVPGNELPNVPAHLQRRSQHRQEGAHVGRQTDVGAVGEQPRADSILPVAVVK
mmetsp:Transcript_3955/g.10997  ORF Transcript_3955/g.10997 Transcript_3955/m.10997 type:complete len:334 (+) Transcript_3955:592-1593(+)